MKHKADAGTGKRYDIPYRQDHCYIVATEQSLDISMVAKKDTGEVDEVTLTGLGLISSLTTLLIERGVDSEDIAAACFENSRRKGDLADWLCKIIEGI